MYYGDVPLLEEPQVCIVDLGSTLVYLPSKAYEKYMEMSNSTLEDGLLTIPSSRKEPLPTLEIQIGYEVRNLSVSIYIHFKGTGSDIL